MVTHRKLSLTMSEDGGEEGEGSDNPELWRNNIFCSCTQQLHPLILPARPGQINDGWITEAS